jgi:hypothetical protein
LFCEGIGAKLNVLAIISGYPASSWRSERLNAALRNILRTAKQFVDAIPVFFGVIEHEQDLGRTPHLQPLAQLVPDKPGSRSQPFDHGGLLGLTAEDADENSRALQVGRYAHFSDSSQPGKPRIFQLARKHGADFVADFAGNTLVPMSCNRH